MISRVFLLAVLIGVFRDGQAGVITESLLNKIKTNGQADVIVELPSVMENVLGHPTVATLSSGLRKSSRMMSMLKEHTKDIQAPFLEVIKKFKAEESTTSFFISNKLSIKNASLGLLQKFLRDIPGVYTIREPYPVNLIAPSQHEELKGFVPKPFDIQWNILRIGVYDVWFNVTKGEGIVVAGIDTGVLASHEILRNNYGGKWFDAVNNRSTPYDDQGHGTHTMGIMAGRVGFGVAVGSTWIACKALDRFNSGTEVTVGACAQWILQQRPLPRVVNNSWAFLQGLTFFNDEIAAWQAAGIIPVFAAGNTGPNCGTAQSPGDQPNVISVGATDINSQIYSLSSRGPAIGSTRLKPEVSAPGVGITSASNAGPGQYAVMSGTSMAAPHVSGAIALLTSADPSMTFTDVLAFLENQAYHWTSSQSCGNSVGIPNNVFGYGEININDTMRS